MRVPWFRAMLIALIVACALAPRGAFAQAAPSEIEVRVTDETGQPVADARIYVSGPLAASQLTPREGVIRFSDVDPGIYRLRIARAGYETVDVNDVEVLPGQRKVIDVALTRSRARGVATPAPSPEPGGLREIGRVQARPSVTVATVDVDEGNPVRRISENLADALDKIAGVSVLPSQNGNTLTISLRNGDPSQTGTSIGGGTVAGGATATLQAVAADLATGVSANAASGFGNVGGSVNFRTANPTKTWQAQMSASYGTYERSSAQLTVTGSVKKLGIAVQHASRGGDSVLTGLRFADTSGETYVHDGSFDRFGDFVKLRYPLGRVTVTAQYLSGTTHSSPVCDRWVTTLPCGYGPGGAVDSNTWFGNVLFQGQVGNVTVAGSVMRNHYRTVDDELGRVVNGTPSPYFSDSRQSVTGFSDYSTFAVHRHTFLLNVGSFNGDGSVVIVGPFSGRLPNVLRQAYTVVGDTLKFSDRWSATVAYGTNVSLAQTRGAADLTVAWTPSRSESLQFGTGVYGGGASQVNGALFSDPGTATYDCAGNAVMVGGPPDAPGAGLYNNAELDYSRRGRRGSINVSLYDREQRGGTLSAQFPLQTLPSSALPPGYVDAIAQLWHAPALCGTEAFDPARIFVSEQIAGTTVRYRGLDASGQVVLGRAVIAQPSYSINGATLASSDPRLTVAGSPYAINAQLPGRPLHRAGLLFDAVQRKANLEYVVNGSWTSANNASYLGSYLQISAGATWTARRGRLTFFVNNLFNTDAGVFAGTQYAQPLALSGGGTLLPVPTLLAPRTYTLLYSVRIDGPPPPRPNAAVPAR